MIDWFLAPIQRYILVENLESSRIAISLEERVGSGADAGQIADTVVDVWQQVFIALCPILGQGGVALLYKRSLYLASPSHPWLAGANEGVEKTMDLALLRSVLAQQDSASAAAGGGAHLQTLYELLTSLVGPSLTERLLRSAWADSSNAPAQEAL